MGLEKVIEQTETYKSKALITRGAFGIYNGQSETALRFYTESLKARHTVSDYIAASRGIALAKSMEGFHASALRELERLLPLLTHAEPLMYFDVLNSYAVELIENSRIPEAHNAALVAASSLFSPFCPEWRATLLEIRSRRKQRSTVSISPPQEWKHEPTALEPANNVVPPPDPRVDIVIDFMKANLERKVSLRELADVANLSQSRLSHVFKCQTEMSPGEYLIRLRMEKARQPLATSALRIKQVMAKAGYYNKSNFARRFRRSFHLSPSEYRKSVSRLIAKSDYLARLRRKTE